MHWNPVTRATNWLGPICMLPHTPFSAFHCISLRCILEMQLAQNWFLPLQKCVLHPNVSKTRSQAGMTRLKNEHSPKILRGALEMYSCTRGPSIEPSTPSRPPFSYFLVSNRIEIDPSNRIEIEIESIPRSLRIESKSMPPRIVSKSMGWGRQQREAGSLSRGF